MPVAAQTDPYAGVGTPVSAPAAPSSNAGSDPYANVGTPVTAPPAASPAASQTASPEAAFFAKHPVLSAFNDVVHAPENLNIGALKSLAGGMGGLMKIMGQYGVVPLTQQQAEDAAAGKSQGLPADALKNAGDWIMNNTQLHGLAQHVGGAAEMIGELLSPMGMEEAPAEAGKAMGFVERMQQQAKVAKFLTDNPKLAKLAAIGAHTVHAAFKTAAETGAQTYVHTGGNTDAATQAAEIGGAGATVLTPVMEGVSSFLANRVPNVESIAGEDVPVARSQQAGGAPKAGIPARELPSITTAQQEAAPRVFRSVAQRATQRALDIANEGRQIPGQITDEARLLAPPADMQPYSFTLRGGLPTEDVDGEMVQPAAKRQQAAFKPPQYTTSSAPKPSVEGVEGSSGSDVATSTPREPARDVASGPGDITTASVEDAQTHLSRLDDALAQPGLKPAQRAAIQASRNDLEEQMELYHRYQRTLPNFQPIDSARTAANVANFGEAADQLQNAARPIYQKIDEATDGVFNDWNRARVAAFKRGDFIDGFKFENKLDDLIHNNGAITPAERLQATKLWSDSKVLDGIHYAVEHAANVNEQYASQVAGGRVLSGAKLQNGLQRVIDKYGTQRIESVVGHDGMENLTRMADLMKLPPPEQGYMRGLSMNIFHNLAHGKVLGAAGAVLGHQAGGWEGALAGAYTGAQAERAILRFIATSPRAGELFDYAVRNKVTPKLAAGLISAEMTRDSNESQPRQPSSGGEQ